MIGPTALLSLLTKPLLAFNVLFADVEEIITIVIFLVVGAVSAISQYLNKKKEAAARERRLQRQAQLEMERRAAEEQEPEAPRRLVEPQRPFGPQPQQPQPRPAAAPVDQDVADEIRDFLERAATGKPAGQAPAAPKPVPPVAASGHRSLADRPVRQSTIGQRPAPTSHPTQRPVEAKAVPQRRTFTNQDQRRKEALQAKKLAEAKRREAEAARVQAAKKQKAETKFDHKLGKLKKQTQRQPVEPAAAAPTPETMATDIATMFADTGNIRQAIVINEILTRPTHRWE